MSPEEDANDLIVTCPHCSRPNAIPQLLIEEAKASFVREKKVRPALQKLTKEIREKVSELFGPRDNPNDWLDVTCANSKDTGLGIHRFQVNINTREVRK
ncbi:MAG TPA: hypothetical protein VF591_11370 [Pyrinomonadaceae bacterium]|jgi:hypothetical protein